ncbi:MAG: hypothetical protein WA110_07565 [Anaerolineaceae bacterium]
MHILPTQNDQKCHFFTKRNLDVIALNNGVYPVTITDQGRAEDNNTVSEAYTTYVTITDGKCPNATLEPEVEEAVHFVY